MAIVFVEAHVEEWVCTDDSGIEQANSRCVGWRRYRTMTQVKHPCCLLWGPQVKKVFDTYPCQAEFCNNIEEFH
jgi:hypothetical protein